MELAQQKRIDATVCQWLADERAVILAEMKQPVTVNQKTSQRDLVTNVDRLVEQHLVERIRSLTPMAQIVSEEGFGDQDATMDGLVWFVDPIDGTLNFVAQQAEFAVMLALYEDGVPVLGWILDVVADEYLHGGPELGVKLNETVIEPLPDRGMDQGLIVVSGGRLLAGDLNLPAVAREALGFRVYGSAGISYLHVLTGRAVGYLSRMKPWDFAAGVALGTSLGLHAGNIDGQPLNMLSSSSVLVATPSAYQQISSLENDG